MNLTPEQEMLKQAADTYLGNPNPATAAEFKRVAKAPLILAILDQLEAVQEAPSLADFASAAELVCRAERVAAEETKAPEDAAYNQAIEHCIAAIRSLVPDTGIHAQTGVKESALQQPVQAVPSWKWARFEDWLASPISPPANPVEYVRQAFDAGRAAPGEPGQ